MSFSLDPKNNVPHSAPPAVSARGGEASMRRVETLLFPCLLTVLAAWMAFCPMAPVAAESPTPPPLIMRAQVGHPIMTLPAPPSPTKEAAPTATPPAAQMTPTEDGAPHLQTVVAPTETQPLPTDTPTATETADPPTPTNTAWSPYPYETNTPPSETNTPYNPYPYGTNTPYRSRTPTRTRTPTPLFTRTRTRTPKPTWTRQGTTTPTVAATLTSTPHGTPRPTATPPATALPGSVATPTVAAVAVPTDQVPGGEPYPGAPSPAAPQIPPDTPEPAPGTPGAYAQPDTPTRTQPDVAPQGVRTRDIVAEMVERSAQEAAAGTPGTVTLRVPRRDDGVLKGLALVLGLATIYAGLLDAQRRRTRGNPPATVNTDDERADKNKDQDGTTTRRS